MQYWLTIWVFRPGWVLYVQLAQIPLLMMFRYVKISDRATINGGQWGKTMKIMRSSLGRTTLPGGRAEASQQNQAQFTRSPPLLCSCLYHFHLSYLNTMFA